MKARTIRQLISMMLILVMVFSMSSIAHAAEVDPNGVDDPAEVVEEREYRFFEDVPLYNQLDYPHVQYGSNPNWTVRSHGCGIACLAMVASYLTDSVYTPAELAEQFGAYNTEKGSYWVLFEDSAEVLGLGFQERTYSWDTVEEALRNGQVVISIQREGLFTSGGHFIVLRGITDEGKVLVNDPNGANWFKNRTMIEGFKNGFEPSLISSTSNAYWIYDRKVINTVPLFNQQDYPEIPFSQGSIATSGCGITCMSMVATYMLDEVHKPDELGLIYNSAATSNDKRMEAAAEGLGIEFDRVWDWDSTIRCLEEGKVVIALMSDASVFTNYGHFIIFTGMTEDGKIMINDPYGDNYNRLDFSNGFDQSIARMGYRGGWVFDKNAQTEVIETEMVAVAESPDDPA